MQKGVFIVIEGVDGSGKAEQFRLLLKRLAKAGLKIMAIDFPRYGKPSAYFIQEYLNGRYGGLHQVGPKLASLFFALDRFDIAGTIRKHLDQGYVVLSNRYVASNMGHQGAKMKPSQRRKFFSWVHELEYDICGIPKPDLNILLSVPPVISYRLVGQKKKRKYLAKGKRDIHESNLAFLKNSSASYREIAKTFPKEFTVIDCAPRGKLLSIKEVHALVTKKLDLLKSLPKF